MIILGIDPGLANTGYGIIKKNKSCAEECLDYGTIQTKASEDAPSRLKKINEFLQLLIKKHKPSALAIESIYFFKNIKSAIPVSQAKGVILLSAAQNNISVYEFSPLQIKMAMTGYGRADKKQIQKMVQVLLSLKKIPQPNHAADALACAICCSSVINSPF